MANNGRKSGLLIVDMQTKFNTANDKETRQNVIAQIKRAMKKHIPIFILEYRPVYEYGKTTRYITKLLDNYDNVHFITKRKDDGGHQVMDYVVKHNLDVKYFITCGVNISFCVAATVRTLIQKYKKKVLIIKDACNCEFDIDKAFDGLQANFDTRPIFESDLVTLV